MRCSLAAVHRVVGPQWFEALRLRRKAGVNTESKHLRIGVGVGVAGRGDITANEGAIPFRSQTTTTRRRVEARTVRIRRQGRGPWSRGGSLKQRECGACCRRCRERRGRGQVQRQKCARVPSWFGFVCLIVRHVGSVPSKRPEMVMWFIDSSTPRSG